ncbi:MAG: O-antigen ligase domain-containing protein, partial [Gammaproteobacteria bacterium]|nr:O-antigen ligase domain-containing protein [Gammaproteobacteria bacterium]
MHLNAERLVRGAMHWTFPLYLAGALYVAGPVVGWVFAGMLMLAWQDTRIHPLVLLWIVAMLFMEVALVVAHIDRELPLTSMLKSSIGWAKGWALMALFIAAGALLRDASVLYRGACHIGAVALGLTPVLVIAAIVGLPEVLFVSPLKILGGAGPAFFEVMLYERDPGFGLPRLRYFTPWAPAIGLVANVLLLLAMREQDPRWRIVGIIGCVIMIVMSLSRLGWIVALTVPPCLFFIGRIGRPATWLCLVPAMFAAGLLMPLVLDAAGHAFDTLMSARADSTLVRGWLADIALQRWQSEAPVWGHGVVEAGPHLVQFMPIGSHHTWLGLLFVKGVAGVVALAVPMFFTFLHLLFKAPGSRDCRTALGIMLVLGLYTFGENLEILAYLYWPGLVMVG